MAKSTELSEPLKPLAAFLGTWQSEFATADGKTLSDVANWQRALNGKAIRTLHSINNGVYGGESLIFWDAKKSSLVFYYFTTADFYTTGTIEVVSDREFVAYEDVSGDGPMSKGITKVKSTSKLVEGGLTVTTSYLKHGSWTTPELRRYKASDKQVIFK